MIEPVPISEIKSLTEYEEERKRWRAAVLELKERRRVRVGDRLTFLFENHDTVRYQIQEMMRIERITGSAEIAHEVETYNELIPGKNELSASLLIEYETPELRAVWLRALLGLEDHVWMVVGDLPPAKARFDTRQMSTERLSSVQYVKFPLTAEQASRFAKGAKIVVDHPRLAAEQALTAEQLEELAKDLA